LVLLDSLPLAVCVPVVERANGAEQVPDVPPVTVPQETVTADVGTVVQLVKEAALA
jgi:hypothetical protein